MNDTEDRDVRIARYAKALSHPTRVKIVRFLATQENCYFGDIGKLFPVSKATISKHLRELKDAGLIHGEIIPPKTLFCLQAEAWQEVKILFSSLIDDCSQESCCH